MPPRGQKSTQEPTFVRAASTSAGAARSPARRILIVIASPCVSIPFPVLYTARPAATFTKKPRPASSYVHTAPILPKHKKSPGWGRMGTRTSRGSLRAVYPARGQAPTDSKRVGAMRDFGEHHQGEVLRISLPRTQVNKDKSKGWAQEKPTSNSVGKGEGAAQNIDPPINTIASNDESAMNFPGSQTKKNVEKRRLRAQKVLRIYRLSVKM